MVAERQRDVASKERGRQGQRFRNGQPRLMRTTVPPSGRSAIDISRPWPRSACGPSADRDRGRRVRRRATPREQLEHRFLHVRAQYPEPSSWTSIVVLAGDHDSGVLAVLQRVVDEQAEGATRQLGSRPQHEVVRCFHVHLVRLRRRQHDVVEQFLTRTSVGWDWITSGLQASQRDELSMRRDSRALALRQRCNMSARAGWSRRSP